MAKNQMHNVGSNKKRKKSVREMIKGVTMTIKVDPMNSRKFTSSEIGRGCGVIKSKKGKGAYTRKAKHRDCEPYGYFVFISC